MSATELRSLTAEERTSLFQAAQEARETSYSPYSKFRVGAALFGTDGKIIKGGNVENVSFGGTICAERTALVKAVTEGTNSFLALAVTSDVPSAITPCGMCRQFVREFCTLPMPVYLVFGDWTPESDEKFETMTLGELLPRGFSRKDLEKPKI